MPKSTFVLPAGVVISIADGKLNLRHEGDVVIEAIPGVELGDVEATGDLGLKVAKARGRFTAGGRLTAGDDLEAGQLHAAEIVLGKGTISARSISADRKITIGAAKLAVDVIMAPEIQIDPKATGRVTVIESLNERGPTKIKGGFSLAEYEEVIGGAEDFLAERGLKALDRSAAPVDEEEPAAEELVDDEPSEPPAPTRELAAPEPEAAAPAEEPAPVEEAHPADEDVDDPLSLSIEDLEPLDDEMHGKLKDAVGRIVACYTTGERPPAVQKLERLVGERDYPALRENITSVWNGLLSYHQERGIRPHHQVTHAFNIIHGLVQGG